MERRRGFEFFCECDDDNDGHNGADCGDNDGRDNDDDRDEH